MSVYIAVSVWPSAAILMICKNGIEIMIDNSTLHEKKKTKHYDQQYF